MQNSPLPPLHPERWLTDRLARVAEFNPRYESSWYGLHIAFLSHYFPYQQKFLIKPQGRLRDPVYEEEFSFSSTKAETSISADLDNSLAGNISITSTGALVVPGSTYCIPDFTIAKATEFTTHDKVFLLVEVKPQEPVTENGWKSYGTQMDEYMEAASQHLEKDASLVGLLICGTVVQISRLASPDADIITERKRYGLNSTAVRRLLHDLATVNWN